MTGQTLLIEHEILIDKYTKITLSIPKQLDASELRALMLKSNKLFSLSEIELQRGSAVTSQRHTWTDSQTDFLADMNRTDKPMKEITRLFKERFKSGLSDGKIEARYYQIKRSGR